MSLGRVAAIIPILVTVRLSCAGSQRSAFTPGSTMSAVQIAQTLEKVRQQLWELYQDLKAYRQQPDAADRRQLPFPLSDN